mgnify:CR=1 FL=1
MNKKQKKMLARIIVAFVLLVALHFVPVEGALRFCCYMVPYLIVGYDILLKAVKGIKNRQMFDECFLMAVATVGAVALALYSGSGDYTEAVAVMLFYQIGELFQSVAVGKSRRNISELMDISPDYANIEVDGQLEQVDPDEVEVGSIIIVQPGEKVPIDGVVLEGTSSLDTSALTGESVPRDIAQGEEVISGCINMTGVLKIRTTKEFGESTVSKILELVENASSRKSKSENFISKFARVYTPAVCYAALALAFLPPLVRMLALGVDADWGTWIYRALTFLVISCPCALVISIPLSFFAGIGGASNAGVLVKGSNYLETLSQVRTVVFDKTGTLTKGNFAVKEIYPETKKEEVLYYAAIAEGMSKHPIAMSIKNAYGDEIKENYLIEDISGKGIKAIGEHVILCGNEKLMDDAKIEYLKSDGVGSVVYVAVDNEFKGYIVIADEIKEDAKETISYLNSINAKTVMLTGDNERIASSVARELGLSSYKSSLLPQNKVEEVDKLLSKKKEKDVLCFVGDGINDAPVLSRADVGIAMGSMGSDAAIEAADVVLMDDDPGKIADIVRISRKTMGIVMQNIVFALGVKFVVLAMGAFGVANMWEAVFADVGVSVLAILNSMRVMKNH